MLTYETGRFILCLDFVGINCSSVIFTGDEYNIKPLTFSSEEWLSTPTPERALMAADLAARKQLLIGKTREKVVDILGRPTGEQLVYSAGKGTGRFDVIIHDDHVENVNWYRGLE